MGTELEAMWGDFAMFAKEMADETGVLCGTAEAGIPNAGALWVEGPVFGVASMGEP